MSTIIQIRDAIKTNVEAVVQGDGTAKIVIVYNYPEYKPTGYPYAYIDFKGDEEEVLNNRQDRTNYEFEVVIIQEKMEEFKGRAEAEETAMERAYAVSEQFRANNDLGLADVLRVVPLKVVKTYVDGATRIRLTITLVVQTIEEVSI